VCGLAGCLRLGRGTAEPDVALLRSMADSLKHRGPDGTSIHVDGQAGLAFTRLSIVDPVNGGQPIISPDGTVALIANGEVYNHKALAATLPAGTRMRSSSDCEVLVHLYQRDGLRFLDMVRGIYAIILWDSRRKKLIFARDRFGIKPLYFHRNSERIIFASEIKALLNDPACPRAVDWRTCLSDQMTTSAPVFADGDPVTYFEGIEAVPAATVLEIDAITGRPDRHPYWRLPSFSGEADAGRAELVRGYREALIAAVEESCMSDAEIGLLLSGGIDSAAVAALAKVPAPLQTFTALNGGTLANGDSRSAHEVAAALGLPNHQVALSVNRVPDPRQWRDLLWQVESPLCGPEQLYKFELHRHARSIRPDLKVMLLGQASDEFNGGYSTVIGEDGWPDFIARLRSMALQTALAHAPAFAPWWEHSHPFVREEVLRDLGGEAARAVVDADPYQLYVRWKYRDIQQYNCWHEDRTAAGNGIEARVPFLDHRVVEAAAAVPPALRADLLWDKRILREALAGILPRETLERPKVPFFYGAGEYHVNRTFTAMLAQDDGALIEEAFSGKNAHRYLDQDGVRATLAELRDAPAQGHIAFLLRIVNLGLLEQMVTGTPLPSGGGPARLGEELPVRDWDEQHAAITEEIFQPQPFTGAVVPAWADNVVVAAPVPSDGTYLIMVDGTVEYLVSEQDDPAWAFAVCRIDGGRTVAELAAEAGDATGVISERLAEAASVGLLTLNMPAAEPEHALAGEPR